MLGDLYRLRLECKSRTFDGNHPLPWSLAQVEARTRSRKPSVITKGGERLLWERSEPISAWAGPRVPFASAPEEVAGQGPPTAQGQSNLSKKNTCIKRIRQTYLGGRQRSVSFCHPG